LKKKHVFYFHAYGQVSKIKKSYHIFIQQKFKNIY
jgi:hypothetical protein